MPCYAYDYMFYWFEFESRVSSYICTLHSEFTGIFWLNF